MYRSELVDHVTQLPRHWAKENRVNLQPLASLSKSAQCVDRGALEHGTVALQLYLPADPEMCAQLRVSKYTVTRNRVIASSAVRSAHRRAKQRDTTARIAPFESCRPAMEI